MAEPQVFLDGKVTLHCGDCLDVLAAMPENSVDSVVTDPPYALVSIAKRFGKPGSAPAKEGKTGAYARASRGFMGKQWDTGERAFAVEFWEEVWRVLKPGGHVLAFSGTRTYHRMVCAIEDAGFEIRDQIGWAYGSGFPKSHDVSKALVKRLGAEREKVRHKPRAETSGTMSGSSDTRPWIEESRLKGYHEVDGPEPVTEDAREWKGWGTALKPAWEPVCVARKALGGTIADNVLAHGTGALNIDACRIGEGENRQSSTGGLGRKASPVYGAFARDTVEPLTTTQGRWPANIVHDGSDEVVSCFPESVAGQENTTRGTGGIWSGISNTPCGPQYGDEGSAARFFYTAKADAEDRLGSKHPTVKPLDLMQYLVRLVTPPRVSYCPQCEARSHGNDSTTSSGPDQGVRVVPEGVQAEGQPAHGPLLQPPVRGSRPRTPAESVRVVRDDLSTSEGRGEEVLHADMCREVERQEQSDGEGVCCEQGGLSPAMDAGASAVTLAEGLHLRASMGDAAEDRPTADQGGSRPPHQRDQIGQSTGELGPDAEGGSRQAEPSSPEHAVLPSLPRQDHHEPACKNCGHRLAYRPGVCLDPFAGTGTTGEAAWREGFRAILIEREAEYQADIARRMDLVLKPTKRSAVAKSKNKLMGAEGTPLFGGEAA